MINCFPPILYAVTTYSVYRRVGRFYSLSVFIWLLHTVSMLCFWIKADFLLGFENDYSIGALALMYFTLFLITIPLIRFEKRLSKCGNIKAVSISSSKFKIVVYSLIILSLYSIAFFVVNLPKVFALDVKEIREGQIIFYESSIFSKVAVLGAFSSVFCIFFYFYLSALNYNRKICTLLLISSLSFIVYTLNVAGRDGIVIWGFSFLAGFFLFHKYLNKRIIKLIKKGAVLMTIITLPLLIYITGSRFSDSSNSLAGFDSVLSYAGQSLPNLSYEIDLVEKIHRRSGDGTFPIALVRSIVGSDENRFDRMDDAAIYGFRSNQFSSYVSFFYPSYSILFLIFFIILFNVIIRSSVKVRQSQFNPIDFIVGYTWYMIPIVGIFYFYYGELIGNVFLLLPFLIRFYLKRV